MRFFRDLSIRRKLILLSSGIGGAAVLAVTLTLLAVLWADQRRTFAESAAALADIMARGSSAAILFDDRRAATENVRAFALHADVEVAALYDKSGAHFATYTRDEVKHSKAFLPDRLAEMPMVPFHIFRSGHVAAYHPVMVRGEQVGTAVVVVGLERATHNVYLVARSVVMTMVVALLLVVALSARLQRLISTPLLALAGLMERVSHERDYTLRAEAGGQDELGALARGFNHMLVQIQARDEALERHREGLERTVEARTRELAQANARLTEELAERKRAEALVRSQNEALESLGSGKPLVDTLEAICHFLESQLPDSRCAVLALMPEGDRLRHVCAPHLPTAYVSAIDSRPIGPGGVRAPVAVDHPAPMFADDFRTHPMWEGARDLALAHGLRSCWCVPVKSPKGGLVGRISVYHAVVTRRPTEPQQRLLETAAAMAGMALERERAQARLAQMAHYDGLTSLPNRRLFTDRLTQALGRARRRQGRVAVLFVDLDRFKPVNDILGHAVGDQVLKELADRLKGALREEDTLARIGGDEFTVILEDLARREDAVRVAQRLLAVVTPPLEVDGQEVVVGASVGIALSPDDGRDAATLVKNADMAMYRAKQSGRGVFCFYAGEMATQASARLRMEAALRHALERGEFRLFLQPQVEAAGGRLVGAEALLRWVNEEIGPVGPDVFVPILEETGLIFPVGEWVLAEACRVARAWPEVHGAPLRVAVNLSGRQLHAADPAALVARVLSDTGLPASRLELELTESVVMEYAGETVERLKALDALGVSLAVDDFGTGYSSLSYLKAFPIGALKIDRSFVRDITEDEGDRAIAAAVISLAHSLNLHVVAEGVENTDQLDVLRELHCDLAQGYLFGRPEPAEAFVARLKALGAALAPPPVK